MDINKLLKPRKIVIIGASEKEGFGGDTCRNAIAYMKEGIALKTAPFLALS